MNKPRIDQGPDYERGFIDGMQYQMQSSVDKAVNRMAQPEQEPTNLERHERNVQKLFGEPQPEPEPDDLTIAYMSGVYDGKKQRTWVGLTSVDWNDFNAVKGNDPQYVAQWVEAKLKEKNT